MASASASAGDAAATPGALASSAEGTGRRSDDTSTYDRLLGRLRLMTFTRVIIVGVLLGATALVEQPELQLGLVDDSDPTDFFLLVVGSVVLGLSLVYALGLRLLRTERGLRQLAYVQLGGDGAFAAALVLLTGGTSSSFTFFFSVTILLAAVVLYRPGALYQATACTILFIAIGVMEVTGTGPAESLTELADNPTLPGGFDESDRAGMVGGLVYKLINNVLAFYALAFLASHLAESLRLRDVQLEETEESLEALSALHDNIIASIPAGVLTTDSNGRITYFNPRAVDITGVPEEAAWAQLASALFPVLEGPMAGVDERPVTVSSTLAQDDGTRRHLQWQVSLLTSPSGSALGHLVTFQDVTNLREMEEQVRVGERFASIGRLAASIAHEIRNPLTAISGSIQLLKQTLDVEGPNARLMTIVGNETDALNKWITDFLMYARPRLSEPMPMNLRALVDDVVTTLEHDQAHGDLVLKVRGPATVMTMGDPTYLRQAIWNLLTNAAQASPEGGKIVCTASGYGTDQVRLSISDQGPGIDPSVRERIFDPFVTTKDGGTGLGLATSYRVVSEHGGRLTFETRVGHGTTFHIDLPAAPSDEDVATAQAVGD